MFFLSKKAKCVNHCIDGMRAQKWFTRHRHDNIIHFLHHKGYDIKMIKECLPIAIKRMCKERDKRHKLLKVANYYLKRL